MNSKAILDKFWAIREDNNMAKDNVKGKEYDMAIKILERQEREIYKLADLLRSR